MLQQRRLGPEAVAFIRDILDQGWTLSSYLKKCELERGIVRAFLPPGIDNDQAHHFSDGGVCSSSQAEQCLVIPVRNFLNGNKRRFYVLEALNPGPDDPWLKECNDPFFIFGDEVYFFVSSANKDNDAIHRAINNAESYLLTGIMTSLPEGQDFIAPRRELSQEQLKLLAERTEHIIIGAYDGESYLIWSKQ